MVSPDELWIGGMKAVLLDGISIVIITLFGGEASVHGWNLVLVVSHTSPPVMCAPAT